jgi:hypothetical protein
MDFNRPAHQLCLSPIAFPLYWPLVVLAAPPENQSRCGRMAFASGVMGASGHLVASMDRVGAVCSMNRSYLRTLRDMEEAICKLAELF